MLFRVRRALHRFRFNRLCLPILAMDPLRTEDTSFTLVSMVPHGEVLMYLLAVRSFVQQLGRVPAIVALSDGTLTDADRTLLHKQFPEIRIESIADIGTGSCPVGNCWERLMLVCSLSESSYVVQLDSDTLSLAPMSEVAECIRENRSFTLLGDRSYPEIETLDDAWQRLRGSSSNMVQAVVERAFNQLPERHDLKYVRGNAGFVGYAKGSLSRESIAYLSERMRTLAGPQWDEWGSEQVTSNLLIANTPNATTLPAPKYLSYWAHPDVDYERAAFLHFIGPFRYSNGLYQKLAVRVLSTLRPAKAKRA